MIIHFCLGVYHMPAKKKAAKKTAAKKTTKKAEKKTATSVSA